MKTGTRVAIGIGATALVAGLLAAAGAARVRSWARDQAQQRADADRQISELLARADSNAFARPADGVVAEDRLARFLAVRKAVHAVYQKHRPGLDGMETATSRLPEVAGAMGAIAELRLAHARALAAQGMSREEYRFLVEQVYGTRWGAAAAGPDRGADGADGDAEDVPAGGDDAEGAAPASPSPNLGLLLKHEAAIRAYALPGLQWLGL